MELMRHTVFLAALCIIPCGPAPHDPPHAERVSTTPWYNESLEQLIQLNQEAQTLLRQGKTDQTAALITKGQTLMTRLLSVQQPTLPAVQASSDLDEMYGRM